MKDQDSNTLFNQASNIIRPHGGIPKLDPKAFEKALLRDKKRKNGKLRSVFVNQPGHFEIRDDVSATDWFDALQESYAILDQPRKLMLRKSHPVVIHPPNSKSEQIRLLSFPSSQKRLVENDDTFFADQIFNNGSVNVHVGEGATGFRFAAIQAAFTGQTRTFSVAPSLSRRTHEELWALFDKANIDYRWEENALKINGEKIETIRSSLENQSTSHIASGLALLAAHNIDVSISWENIASFSYFEMTLSLLEQAGATIERNEKSVHILPFEMNADPTIDLDAGAYAFWMILKRLGVPAEIIGNIDAKRQPDFRIESLLDEIDSDKSCTLDLNATPDLGPVLGSYAALRGKDLTIVGAQHLRNKESNRIEDFLAMLKAVNIECLSTSDGFTIYGSRARLQIGTVECCGDHRLVMAAAILSIAVEVTLSDPMCVSKSYWNFWQDLRSAGFLYQLQFEGGLGPEDSFV